MPKSVVSSTLAGPLAWANATLLQGDLVQTPRELKQEEGSPILVHGSLELVQSLLQAGLVDDLRLMISPVLVGGGRTIFPGAFETSVFTRTATDTVLPNVQACTYTRKPKEGEGLRAGARAAATG